MATRRGIARRTAGRYGCPSTSCCTQRCCVSMSYYGEDFKIECPTGSGQLMTLLQMAKELGERLCRIFLKDPSGSRPVNGAAHKLRDDPHWRDLVLFFEYFHGDTGTGVGA